MKEFFNIIILSLIILLSLNIGCEQSLEVIPKGIITESQLSEPEHVEGLVIAAYAYYGRIMPFETFNPWITSIRSDDAYKGGGGLSDQPAWYQMEVFSLLNSNVGNNNAAWEEGFVIISRINTALKAIIKMDESEYPLKNIRMAEMRFLRGWIYTKLKLRWKWVPFIDENETPESIYDISNRPDYMENDLPLWQKIYDDFKFASDNLPEVQSEIGRANKFAAKGFLAHTLLWMAYPQNDKHEVIGLNKEKLNEALEYCNYIIDSGLYRLSEDFAYNFMYDWGNKSSESIWELQFSIDDGTRHGLLNTGNGLTAPWWTPHFSCCDFHKASVNLLNAFRVGENGLPLFDSFNEEEIDDKNDYFNRNQFDPRLGHTIAIPGFPWKYTELVFDSAGTRVPSDYGYLHSMKENYRADCPCKHEFNWVFDSKNQIELRLAEVMLWKAEILIKLDRHKEALPIINELRNRSGNSTNLLRLVNNSFPTTYYIESYVDGNNINWDKETAWQALVWEKRLEYAMEGRRLNDLVRWGIAAEVLNDFFEKEKNRRYWYNVAHFTKGRDEYLPIPQSQINWSQGVYKQNSGY